MSKMVWIIAAVVLTASVIGVFNWQRASLKEVEMEQRADQVSSLINKLINTEGEFTGTVSFNESRDSDFHLSSTLDGEGYLLNFTPGGLFLEQDGKRCWSGFLEEVHLYSPTMIGTDSEISLGSIDAVATSIPIESSKDFFIQSKSFEGDYEVFVYPEIEDEVKQNVNRTGKSIEDFLDWTIYPKTNLTKVNQTKPIRSNISIEVFPSFILYQNGSAAIPYPIDVIHLWKPIDHHLNATCFESRVSENRSHRFERGEEIALERSLIYLDENLTVMNFAYKSETDL